MYKFYILCERGEIVVDYIMQHICVRCIVSSERIMFKNFPDDWEQTLRNMKFVVFFVIFPISNKEKQLRKSIYQWTEYCFGFDSAIKSTDLLNFRVAFDLYQNWDRQISVFANYIRLV